MGTEAAALLGMVIVICGVQTLLLIYDAIDTRVRKKIDKK